MVRPLVLAAAAWLLLSAPAAGPAAAAPGVDDFTLDLRPGEPPRARALADGASIEVMRGNETVVEVRVTFPGERATMTVRSEGWFNVTRPTQVVPESRTEGIPDDDWHFFTEADDPADPGRASWARAVNYTSEGDNVTLAMVFPVNTTTREAWLRLTRDVEPPGFSVGAVRNITHFSFYVETTTTEYAFADLQIRPAAGGEVVRNPTAILALLQRFPVQGLRDNTSYAFEVVFTDWAGNAARSAPAELRTLPKPDLPKPLVVGRFPDRNATVGEPVSLLWVNFTGPAPASLDGVRVFLDKRPTHEGVTLGPGFVEIRPPTPLGPGPHSVGVELTPAEGGTAVEHWRFDVARPAPGLAALAGWVALAGAALLPVRRRG